MEDKSVALRHCAMDPGKEGYIKWKDVQSSLMIASHAFREKRTTWTLDMIVWTKRLRRRRRHGVDVKA